MKSSGYGAILLSTLLAAAVLAQTPSPAPGPARGPDGDRGGLRGPARPAGQPGQPDRARRGGAPGKDNREAGMDRIMAGLVHSENMAKQLGLDEAQRETLKKLLFDSRAAQADLEAAMQKAALKQAELMLAETVDEEAVLAAVEEAGAARTALAKARIKNLLAMREVLTEEQRKKLREQAREWTQTRPDEPRREGRPDGKPEGGRGGVRGDGREGRPEREGGRGERPGAKVPVL